jgi:hypothetical protein
MTMSGLGQTAVGPNRRRHGRSSRARRVRALGAVTAACATVGLASLAPAAHGSVAHSNTHSNTSSAATSAANLDPVSYEDELIGDAHADEHAEAAAESLTPAVPAAELPVKNAAPAAIGQWSAPFTPAGGITAIHMVLMDTGKILMWTDHAVKEKGESYTEYQAIAEVYDPVTRKAKRVDPPLDNNIFCGYATTLADGRVLVVGGLDPDHGYSGQGIPVVLTFDPVAMKWTVAPPMHQGRWYPSLVRLANGSTVVIGGHTGSARNVPNNDVEVIPPNVTAPQLVAQYKVGAGEDMYPSEFQLPDGQIFSITSKNTSFLDPTTWKITKGPAVLVNQYTYPNGTILPLTPGGDFQIQLTGGRSGGPQTNWPATTSSVRIDMSSATPAFKMMTPLPQSRTNSNTILLPDGTLLMVGGNQSGNVNLGTYQALQYKPGTDTWTVMAAQAKRRAYHSTAVLLPDGTVLSGGDNNAGGGGAALEIYSPPYLFNGARPKILTAPTTALRGGTIAVTTDTAVQKVELIAPGADTHATDLSQRLVQLATAPASGTALVATLPADNTLPPGPYMLFVVNAKGVPSVASWVTVS